MGFGQREKIESEFELTDEPILILVDDLAGRVDWTPALRYLSDYLGQELITNNAAQRIIPAQTLHNIRRHHTDFEQLPARRIGELAKARQVIFIEAQEFRAEEEFYEPTNAAYFAVTVKVIDVTADDRRGTRLWPTSPQGRYVSSKLDGSAVSRAKTKDGIARALAQDLAFTIGRFFYSYRPGDFEQ